MSLLITEGSKYGVYLIITTSIVTEDEITDYLYYNIKNHIYFYGRNIEKYNKYTQKISNATGIINYNNKRLRTPKIDKVELKNIVDYVKGLK